jgi:hypothetical protein
MGYTKGSTMTAEQVAMFCKERMRKLDSINEELSMFPKTPKGYNPFTRIWEVEAARRAISLISRGKIKEALRWLMALPTAIGRCQLLNNEMAVHLGLAYLAIQHKDQQMPMVGARVIGSAEPWAWKDARKLIVELNMPKDTERPLAYIVEKGYDVKTEGIGYSTCIGFATLSVDFDNPEDWRTFKNLKVVNTHSCDLEFFANEPFHRYRCPSCDGAIKEIRLKKKGKSGMTKGHKEMIINQLLNDLK